VAQSVYELSVYDVLSSLLRRGIGWLADALSKRAG